MLSDELKRELMITDEELQIFDSSTWPVERPARPQYTIYTLIELRIEFEIKTEALNDQFSFEKKRLARLRTDLGRSLELRARQLYLKHIDQPSEIFYAKEKFELALKNFQKALDYVGLHCENYFEEDLWQLSIVEQKTFMHILIAENYLAQRRRTQYKI